MTNADNSTQAEIVPTEDFKAAATLCRQNGLFSMRDGQEMTMSNEFIIATLKPAGNIEYALQNQRVYDLQIGKENTAVIRDSANNPILAIEHVDIKQDGLGNHRTHYAIWASNPVKCDLN